MIHHVLDCSGDCQAIYSVPEKMEMMLVCKAGEVGRILLPIIDGVQCSLKIAKDNSLGGLLNPVFPVFICTSLCKCILETDFGKNSVFAL